MSEWDSLIIEDICKKITSGGTPLTTNKEYYFGGNIPWIKTKEVNQNRIYTAEFFITELGLQNSSAKLIPINSVIVAMYGDGKTAGRVALNKIPVTTNQACCNLIIDEEKADSEFVFYNLQNRYEELVFRKTGSGQQNLNAKIIKTLEIDLPPLPEQQAIASVLSALDDKIDLLQRQNQTLEQMAHMLISEYFLIGENINENIKLAKISDFVSSVSITHKFPNEKVVFLNTSDIYKGFVINHEYSFVKDLPGQAKKSIAYGDILFSEIRPANGRYCLIDFDADNYVVSTKLMVLRTFDKKNIGLIYFYLSHPNVMDWLQVLAESRSGTFPQITFDQLANLELKIPDEDNYANLLNDFSIFQDKIFSNSRQIQTLQSLRDTLLPKLVSGEVRLKGFGSRVLSLR